MLFTPSGPLGEQKLPISSDCIQGPLPADYVEKLDPPAALVFGYRSP